MNHPRGLYTLFFTEMWERFSYYGLRALLVLFMTSVVTEGGAGFDDVTATAIYGLYTAGVYLAALPGGWIADRLLGAQRSVWYGGIIIMCGHFTLAIPSMSTFFLGLVLVVLGTGLLKPNISAIVGHLYGNDLAARDAGYTIFYIGINVGAMLGPLVCSTLGESKLGWHAGFAAAGVGMFFGLVQFHLTKHHLGDAGRFPIHLQSGSLVSEPPKHGWLLVNTGLGLLAMVVALAIGGVTEINAVLLAKGATYFIISIAALFFIYVFVFGQLTQTEKKHVIAIIILFVASAAFWSGFEQAGSSLNLFAERYTDREFFGLEIPTGWMQSLNALFILIFAPFFAALWINLARRNLNPAMHVKFALGLIQLGLGFLVMMFAAKLVLTGDKVLPTWLILTYLFHTTGELCLSPVGLSSISKLSPKRYMGQMMGGWFLSMSLGNLLAGLFAGRFDPNAIEQMPDLYLQIVLLTVGTGLILLIFMKPIQKLLGDIR